MRVLGSMLLLVSALSCGSAQRRPAHYVPGRAPTRQPVAEPKLDLSDVTRPLPPFAPLPKSEQSDAEAVSEETLEEADEAAFLAEMIATRSAMDGRFEGVVHRWIYRRGELYEVLTRVGSPTTIQLEAGEITTEEPVVGDGRGWGELGHARSGDDRGRTVHNIVIRPEKLGPDADVTVFTNRRKYHLRLRRVALGEPYVREVSFHYPDRELAELQAQQEARREEEEAAAKTPVVRSRAADGCTSANYEIDVMKGSPSWVPTMVWRSCDGDIAKVHIQFRPEVRWSRIPTLTTDGGVATYGYDPKEHVMHADGFFSKALLTLGTEKEGFERVRIRALKEPR